MKSYGALRGKGLRAHHRLLRRIAARPQRVIYVRTEAEFRMAERLHHARLLTACVSKWSWFPRLDGRGFRELALFANEIDARRQYAKILPRHCAL